MWELVHVRLLESNNKSWHLKNMKNVSSLGENSCFHHQNILLGRSFHKRVNREIKFPVWIENLISFDILHWIWMISESHLNPSSHFLHVLPTLQFNSFKRAFGFVFVEAYISSTSTSATLKVVQQTYKPDNDMGFNVPMNVYGI